MSDTSVSPTSAPIVPAAASTPEPVTQNYPELPNEFCTLGDKQLAQQKLLAIEAVLMGLTQADIAKHAGISRKTLYNWRRHDQVFRDELRRRQELAWETSVDRLRAMIPRAISILRSDAEDPYDRKRTRAALAILRLANLRAAIPMKPQSG